MVSVSRLVKLEKKLNPTDEILMKVLNGATPKELETIPYNELKKKYKHFKLMGSDEDIRAGASANLFMTAGEQREYYLSQFKFVTIAEMVDMCDN